MAESAAVTARVRRGASRFPDSIESRSSWVAATITTAIPVISYGAPLLVVVGLKRHCRCRDHDQAAKRSTCTESLLSMDPEMLTNAFLHVPPPQKGRWACSKCRNLRPHQGAGG